MPTINDLPRVSTSTNLSDVIIPVQETVNGVSVTKSAPASLLFGKGYSGSQGPQGTLGYTGSVGSIGYTGSGGGGGGGNGYTGSFGYTGSRGLSGNNGGAGPQGPIGYTGSSGGGGGLTTTSTSVDRSMAYWVGTGGDTLYSAANVLLSADDLALEVSNARVGITVGVNGADNLVLGIGAMGAETDVSYSQYNTAIGHGTLAASTGVDAFTESQKNTAIGYNALNNHVSGEGAGENTAVGYLALRGFQQGSNNTAVGSNALGVFLGTGSRNTAIGSHAFESLTSSNNNIAIGTYAGTVLTSGGISGNIIIGAYAEPSVANASGQIVIGYSATGIGNDTAFIGGTNGAYNGANSTTWAFTSDERIKKNIVDNSVGLSAIEQVRIRSFNYKSKDEMPLGLEGIPLASNLDTTKTVTGVIAQEFQQIFPTSVKTNSNGVLSINTDEMMWAMVNAIKELSNKINDLELLINSSKV